MKPINNGAADAAQGHSCHAPGGRLRDWFRGRRGVVIGTTAAVTAAATGFALAEGWIAVRDLVPLLFAVPCAAMMFMCMTGMNHRRGADSKDSAPRA